MCGLMQGVRGVCIAAQLSIGAMLAAPVNAGSLECGTSAPDASRVVVAGGSLTEILYALGEESRIVAVDRTATYPEEAKDLPQIGYVRNLSVEGVLSLRPTLVLGEHDMGPPNVVEQLRKLDVDLLLVPERFDAQGIRDKIACVAAAVGVSGRGAKLAAKLLGDAEVQSAEPAPSSADSGAAAAGLVLLGLRSGSPVAAGRGTSGDGLLAMAGASNLMQFAGWKPVSAEAMAVAQPDFIVIPERGLAAAGGVDKLLDHPALRLTPAAKKRAVIAMDGMAMLGFGPRTAATAAALSMQLYNSSSTQPESRPVPKTGSGVSGAGSPGKLP